MKYNLFYAVCSLALLSLLGSCERDELFREPDAASVEISPNIGYSHSCYAGDPSISAIKSSPIDLMDYKGDAMFELLNVVDTAGKDVTDLFTQSISTPIFSTESCDYQMEVKPGLEIDPITGEIKLNVGVNHIDEGEYKVGVKINVPGVEPMNFNNITKLEVQHNALPNQTWENRSLLLSNGKDTVDNGEQVVKVAPLNVPVTEFTMELKIKRMGPQRYNGILFFNGNGENVGINIDENNNLRYHPKWGYNPSLTVPDNKWCHVALVIKPESAMLYIDGEYAINNDSHSSYQLKGDLWIGQQVWYRRFSGMVDDVRIWNRALTVEELEKYKDGVQGYEKGLVAAYDFNMTDGTLLQDITGNGHDGELTGYTETKNFWKRHLPQECE